MLLAHGPSLRRSHANGVQRRCDRARAAPPSGCSRAIRSAVRSRAMTMIGRHGLAVGLLLYSRRCHRKRGQLECCAPAKRVLATGDRRSESDCRRRRSSAVSAGQNWSFDPPQGRGIETPVETNLGRTALWFGPRKFRSPRADYAKRSAPDGPPRLGRGSWLRLSRQNDAGPSGLTHGRLRDRPERFGEGCVSRRVGC